MAESLTSQDSVEESLGQPNPGERLRQAREQQQLSLADVSERLKLSETQLEALENGDIQKLPGLAFVRGYLRGYSKLLGLDADQLVEEFNALHGGAPQSNVTSINRVKPQAQMGDPMLRISVIIFVLALIGTSIWWWQTQMGAETEAPMLDRTAAEQAVTSQPDNEAQVIRGSVDAPAPESPAEPLQAADPSSDEVAVGENGVEEGTAAEEEPRYLSDEEIAALARQMEQQSQGSASETGSEPQADSATEPADTAATSAGEAGSEPLLLVRFNAECWVSIKTADGKTIFASLMQAGNVLERKLDNLPVELLLGQSASIETAEFRGLPLPVEQSSNKGVARLTLE
ncbi:helix-turn-helix domain-containing protein [Motiliproteus coralliicola]|uniref:Helix-turn-helix domain-containing protein n=1 Tax=Motiliproteus coralliicola TaxID=2283196 RepID=A0A369WP67_9GAMM|nr:RodZ family helix-turn-helix domain-containing protein [Motiliproteus coralliicola]RDE23013.1 helix-turn-helix domain-containing protein [Motiliproteus coralliicola]